MNSGELFGLSVLIFMALVVLLPIAAGALARWQDRKLPDGSFLRVESYLDPREHADGSTAPRLNSVRSARPTLRVVRLADNASTQAPLRVVR